MKLTIKEVQELAIDMLKEVVRICNENGLTYFMDAGSVLGTIRHGGIIPWDHDIDISIPENELKRFIKVMEKKLPNKYYLDFNTKNKYYPCMFPRIGITGATTKNIHIDCFRLVGIPDEREKQQKFSDKATRIKWMYYMKAKAPSGKIYKKFAEYMIKVALLPFSRKRIRGWFEKHIATYPYEQSNYVKNPCGCYGMKSAQPKTIFGEGIEKEFEGFKVRLPVQYDKYLTNYYGDYMKFPPEADRNRELNRLFEM